MHKYKVGEKVWAVNFGEAEQLTVRAHEPDGRYELTSLPVEGMARHILSGWKEKDVFPDKLLCLLRILSNTIIFRDLLSEAIRKALPFTDDEAKLEQALEEIQKLITTG